MAEQQQQKTDNATVRRIRRDSRKIQPESPRKCVQASAGLHGMTMWCACSVLHGGRMRQDEVKWTRCSVRDSG